MSSATARTKGRRPYSSFTVRGSAIVCAYSCRQLRRARYSVKGWMFGLYQKPVSSIPSARSASIGMFAQGAQQMCMSSFMGNSSSRE